MDAELRAAVLRVAKEVEISDLIARIDLLFMATRHNANLMYNVLGHTDSTLGYTFRQLVEQAKGEQAELSKKEANHDTI